jgi:serine/threonine protein kinase
LKLNSTVIFPFKIFVYMNKLITSKFTKWMIFLMLQARYFFQQLLSGVSYCHSMVWKDSEFVVFFIKKLASYIMLRYVGNLSQRSEIGKHSLGRKSISSA